MQKIGPRNGARVVARAWTDPGYKKRLLTDGAAAILELGYGGAQGEYMVVLENSPKVHNLVVCTLCSCYPWPTLGLPPAWYKSSGYRSRAVIDPRGVLREFGLELPDDVAIRVWDSTSEVRYLVLPERPAGTDAHQCRPAASPGPPEPASQVGASWTARRWRGESRSASEGRREQGRTARSQG